MHTIKIEVLYKPFELIDGIPCLWGKITLNNFEERFIIALECWTLQDYQRQWQEGLERIKTHTKSCLVTYVQDPCKAPWINWWLLYKINNKIHIQNQIIFGKNYVKYIGKEPFNPDTCYNFIQNRRDAKKYQLSEWIVDFIIVNC